MPDVIFTDERICVGADVCAELTIDRTEWRVYQRTDGVWAEHSIETSRDAAAAVAVSLAQGAA